MIISYESVLIPRDDLLMEILHCFVWPMLNDILLNQKIALFVEVEDVVHEFKGAIGLVGPQQARNDVVADPVFPFPESVILSKVVVSEAYLYDFVYFSAINQVLYEDQILVVSLRN